MVNKFLNKKVVQKHIQTCTNILALIATTIGKVIKYSFSLLKDAYTAMPLERRQRVISAVVIFIIFTVVVIWGKWMYALSIMVCCFIMIHEKMKMLENIRETNNSVFYTLKKFVIAYLIICSLSLIAIRTTYIQGAKITLWMFLTAWGTDCGAYIFGEKYGKLKLAPSISPKKTYEGAIFGTITGFCISIILYNMFYTAQRSSFSLLSFAIISILVTILAQLGDLTESVVKRQCGVKDSGNIIPGHGGMFDRLDSVLLIAPCICIMLFFNGGVIF